MQHVAPNNVVMCCDRWPELENVGPTILGNVGLICCDRLAGALAGRYVQWVRGAWGAGGWGVKQYTGVYVTSTFKLSVHVKIWYILDLIKQV